MSNVRIVRQLRNRKLFVTDDEKSDGSAESLSQDEGTRNDERQEQAIDEDEKQDNSIKIDDNMYSEPADTIYLPQVGGKSRYRAPENNMESDRDSGAESSENLLDEDGYTIIPDPPSTRPSAIDNPIYSLIDQPTPPIKLARRNGNCKKQTAVKPTNKPNSRPGSPARYAVPKSVIKMPASLKDRPLPPLPKSAPPAVAFYRSDARMHHIMEENETDEGNYDHEYEEILQISDDDEDTNSVQIVNDQYQPLEQHKSTSSSYSHLPSDHQYASSIIQYNPNPVRPQQLSHSQCPPLPLKKRFHLKTPLPPPSRIKRELGFSPSVIGISECRFVKSCIHDGYQHQIEILNSCNPMPVYILESLAEPVISRRAVRYSGMIKPIMKIVVLINYYYVGMGRLSRSRTLAKNLLQPQLVESLRRKLEPHLPPHPGLHSSPCIRLLGRLNITNAQHATCADILDNLLKPLRDADRKMQHMECARMFRAKNLLFRALRFTREHARNLYLRNLDTMNEDTDDTELSLVISSQPHPTRDDIINDAIFVLALGNAIYSFERTLSDLRSLIHFLLEDLADTLYYVYFQLPYMREEYRSLCCEIATEVSSSHIDGQGLAALSKHILAFARRCSEDVVFITPTYTKFLIRCAALDDAGYMGFSIEKAANTFANTDLFRPIPTEGNAKNLLRRTLHFTKVEAPTGSGRQIPTAHISTHANVELHIRATRIVAPVMQKLHERAMAAANSRFSPKRGGSL